jgi:acyl carrier protein
MSKQEFMSADFDNVLSIIMENLRERVPESTSDGGGDFSRETILLGGSGILDSLGLVSLIISVEQGIEDALGISISLADEKAMSQSRSPYRTVGSLAEYATRLIMEEKMRDG